MRYPAALNWLLAPKFADPSQTRLAAMVWVMLWSLLLLSIPILFVVEPFGDSFKGLMFGNVVMASMLILTRRGYVRIAGVAIPTALLGVITYVSVVSDGIHDVAVVGYFLVITVAALLIGKSALVVYTLLVVAAYGAMAVAELNGVLVNDFSFKTGRQDIIIFAVICACFAILLRVTLQYLVDNLTRAEAGEKAVVEQNAQITASRAEVERLNAELEARIAARTSDLLVAKQENEQLYNISRDVNSAQNFVELVDAAARHLERPEFTVTLCFYDTFDKASAVLVDFVAQRPGGEGQTVAIRDDQYSAEKIREWLTDSDIMVLEDVKAAEAEIHPEMLVELKTRHVRSFIMAELSLRTRVMGYLMLALPYKHTFSADDMRVMRAIAELVAAAAERIRLYSEQVDMSRHLREADEVKSRFMANMSHELRTPLNAILNFTRFVSSGMLGTVNAEQMDALSKTITSGKHLLSLINDVLDVTKIESQMLTLFVETSVDLRVEIEAAVTAGEGLLVEKQVALIRDIPDSLPLITGDRRRLRQVLLNLVSNACKFTEEGSVTVRARQDGATIVMEVRDTGPGIAAEDHEAIFEPFRQSRRGMLTSGGTGLGLAIARRLVEAHHGTLTVESALGKGAVFAVILPVDSEALRALIEPTEDKR